MSDKPDTSAPPRADPVAYDVRRASEERRKAAEAPNEHLRQCRLEIAAIFEARARGMATLH